MAELVYASDLESEFCRFESYYGYRKRFVYIRQDRNVQNWRMGEWLKPADCKSALRTGTGVRIPLLQQKRNYGNIRNTVQEFFN